MSLYEGSVKKPIMTSLCFVAVAILGIFSLTKLPIDLYPDIETNTIMVMTACPGASAADIENNLTRPCTECGERFEAHYFGVERKYIVDYP